LGGFQLCNQHITRPLTWCENWQFLAIVPTFEVTTATSRGLLPSQYARNTVVEALRNSALLVHAVNQQEAALLKQVIEQDTIHEPYRGEAIPYFQQLRSTLATQDGVLGTIISGSGPTVLVVHLAEAEVSIRTITQQVLSSYGIENARLYVLQQDTHGARILTP
jgi:homoserine kinase